MGKQRTFVALGQRYVGAGGNPWRTEHQLTILDVRQRPGGSPIVTYRSPNGRRLSAPALHFEEALASGRIIPVIGIGRITSC